MLAPIPATKLNEIIQYFGIPALKDLRPFGVIGKKKVELKKSMSDLLSKDPVAAHTGLGIIYIYENEENLCLMEFKKAYEKSGYSTREAIHYANALFIYGQFEKANPIYKQIIKDNQNDKHNFIEIIKRFSDFCFFEDLKEILDISYVSRELPLEAESDIDDGYRISSFLEKHAIPMDLYRRIRNSIDKVFYQYFSLPTQPDYITFYDLDNFTFNLEVKSELFNDPIETICNMNEDLQDKIIDHYEEFNIQLGSSKDRITAYYTLTT